VNRVLLARLANKAFKAFKVFKAAQERQASVLQAQLDRKVMLVLLGRRVLLDLKVIPVELPEQLARLGLARLELQV
jgi:hypothetical protein